MLLRFLNFLRQPSIHKLKLKSYNKGGGLVIYNYGKSDTVILEYVLCGPKCKNDEILVCLSMQILTAKLSRITVKVIP